MPLANWSMDKWIATVWLIGTIVFAVAAATLFGSDELLFGLPWIVYLSIICQLSILGLYFFIAKRIWICKEGSE